MNERRFQVVDDSPDEIKAVHPTDRTSNIATDVLMLSLKALSQRALTALASLFTLLTVGSAFVLWYSIPDPSTTQIVSLALYAIFILAANIIVRKF